MIHQQTAPLELQLLAKTYQLFALPRNVSGLFLRFARHSNHRQLPRVPIQITRQTLTQRRGIARIGFYPGALLIEFCAARLHSSALGVLSIVDTDQTQIRTLRRPHARCDPRA
jgi:hypothetical protein